MGAPALWAAEGFLRALLTSCGGPITRCLVETRGPLPSRSHTSVGPGLLGNWSPWQVVNGRQVSEDSSVFTATPPLTSPCPWKIIFQKPVPCHTGWASWFKPFSLHVIHVKLSLTEVEATLFKAPGWKVAKAQRCLNSPGLEKGGAHRGPQREGPAGGDRQRGDSPRAGDFCAHRRLSPTLQEPLPAFLRPKSWASGLIEGFLEWGRRGLPRHTPASGGKDMHTEVPVLGELLFILSPLDTKSVPVPSVSAVLSSCPLPS